MRIIWADNAFVITNAPDRDHLLAKEHAGFKFHSASATWRGDAEAMEKLGRIKMRLSTPIYMSAEAAQVYREAGKKILTQIELSRATDADIDIPVPEGLEYLPYQKAGINFALRVFGGIK